MSLSTDEKNLCEQLTYIMECIDNLMTSLGESPSNYKCFGKVKNLAKNKDKNGFKNITFYLNSDGRMLYDNGIYNDDLLKEIEQAYLIAEKLS